MKQYVLLFLSLPVLFMSCSGQAGSQVKDPGRLNTFIIKGDTVKELGNNVMVIYQDKSNTYWFGSWQNGVYRYDGRVIVHYTTKHGLPNHRINEIREDRSGAIYFNTSGGVCRFDGNYFTVLHETPGTEKDWRLNPDDLWFKCVQYPGQVYRYDGKTLYRLQLPKTKVGEDYVSLHPGNANPYEVYTIYKDSRGNIWFGTAALGVCRYTGGSFDWISEEDVTELHNGPANGVRSVIEDGDGYFWFNSAYKYNVYNKPALKNNDIRFYQREKNVGSLDGDPAGKLNEYLSIARDTTNNIWIATYANGAYRYNGRSIQHYPVYDVAENVKLFFIYKDNAGNVWIGTHEHGVFKFNGKIFERYKH